VADEIRKLAETSTEQSKQIAIDLNTVVTTIHQVVDRSAIAAKSFSLVFDEVDQVRRVNSEIENSMTEQRQGGDELLHTLKSLNDITAEVQTGSQEMNRGSSEILRTVEDLNVISAEIRHAMEEIRQGTGEIRNAVDIISQNGESSASHLVTCNREMSQFKV